MVKKGCSLKHSEALLLYNIFYVFVHNNFKVSIVVMFISRN